MPTAPNNNPGPQNAASQWISAKSRTAVTHWYGFLDRNYHGSKFEDQFTRYLSTDKAVKLRILPLALVLSALGVLIYRQGLENNKGHNGDQAIALKQAATSGAAYGLAWNIGGAYPLLGMGKTLWDVSNAQTDQQRLHAVVNNLLYFSTGYVAMMLGRGLTDAMEDHEDRRLLQILQDTQTEQMINQFKDELTPLKQSMHELKAGLKDYFTLFDQKKAIPQDVRERIFTAKDKILELVNQENVRKALTEDTATIRATRRLFNLVDRSHSLYIAVARWLNPMAAFILATSFIAMPLAKKFNHHNDAKHPNLALSSFNPFFEDSAHGSGHGASHGPTGWGSSDDVTKLIRAGGVTV